MKLLYMGILRNTDRPAVELCHETELSDFSRFTKGSVAEFLTFFSKTVAERTPPGQRSDVEEQSYTFHAYSRSEGICGMIISDHEYPAMVAHQLLSKVVDEFLTKHPSSTFRNKQDLPANTFAFPELAGYIKQYQNPENADSIMKIQKELDETKVVLHKTIQSVLDRGEKIDEMVDKSKDLSERSKKFKKAAAAQNSCCTVM